MLLRLLIRVLNNVLLDTYFHVVSQQKMFVIVYRGTGESLNEAGQGGRGLDGFGMVNIINEVLPSVVR